MKRFVFLAAAAVVGCAKQDNTADSTKVTQAGAADAPRVVTVMAHDFSYTGVPDTIPAGVTAFSLQNNGTTLHHLLIVRLDSGKTVADLTKALAINPHFSPLQAPVAQRTLAQLKGQS